jgi:aminopeptidase N
MLAMLDSELDAWSAIAQPLVAAFADLLTRTPMQQALLAEMLVLPGEKYIGEMLEQVDVHRVHAVREALRSEIASANETQLLAHYRDCAQPGPYRPEPTAIALRRLRNICLGYLLQLQREDHFELCRLQYEQADNMTDQIACLQMIVHFQNPLRERVVTDFYQQWQDNTLVIDKWFSALGSNHSANALEQIRPLFVHSAYTLTNPNRARSLLGSMIANSSVFHRTDGSGYALAAEKILLLDAINPQVAARLANPFVHWRRLESEQGLLLKAQIEAMLESPNMSNDLNELLTTSLDD